METPRSKQSRFGDFLKRAFDIIASLLGMALLSPVFLIIAIAIRRDSPGPVFYRGRRYGLGGKEFKILKFRTMYEDQASYMGPRITAQDDPRVTPIGRWLRDTKLNELPQLWNILKGDMSLVGPRPEDPEISITMPREIRDEILSVRPGLTSPASVLYRNEETLLNHHQVMDTYLDSILPTKMRLDQLYVRNRSFWMDLDTLFLTLLFLLPRMAAYEPQENLFFWGPISRLMQRYISWFAIDILITFVAFAITGVLWRVAGPFDVGWAKSIGIAIGFSWVFSMIGALFGVNRIAWGQARSSDVFDLVPAAGIAGLVILGINAYLDLYPPEMIVVATILAFIGFVAVRYRSRLVTGVAGRLLQLSDRTELARERVLIVGGGQAGQFAAWQLQNAENMRLFHVVGFVDDDMYKQGLRIQGAQVLGKREEIPSLVEKHDIGIIVFAIHKIAPAERKSLLDLCRQSRAHVILLPDFLGALNAYLSEGKNIRATSEKGIEYTWPGVSLDQLDEWLAALERASMYENILQLRTRLTELRAKIHSATEPLSQPEKIVLPEGVVEGVESLASEEETCSSNGILS
jgi:lipopolysaccharide/colanic/teichoic acid biosynthesis glycosyltransferase